MRQILFVFIGFGALAPSAFASVHLNSKATIGGTSNSLDQNFNDVGANNSLLDNTMSGNGASVLVSASSTFGQLHSRVMTTRSQGGYGASGGALLEVYDQCTATSNTLAYGTPFDMTINLLVHVNFSHPSNWTQSGLDDVNFKVQGNFVNFVTGDLRDSGTKLISITQHWNIGATSDVYYNMLLSGISAADPGGVVDIDASNTAYVFMTSSVPDVQFVSGSGQLYATSNPVPEPASIAGLCIGALGCIAAKRRKR